MKRVLATVLALAITCSMLMIYAASAGSKVTAKSHSFTDVGIAYGYDYQGGDNWVKYTQKELGLQGVTVTCDKYYGSIDAAAVGITDTGVIHVVAANSDVKFKINATNPDAYYNYCYNSNIGKLMDENPYVMIYDDYDGHLYHYSGDGYLNGFHPYPIFVAPNRDKAGQTNLSAAAFNVGTGRKINSNTYAYNCPDGLRELVFQAKPTEDDGLSDATNFSARYTLGTFLFVNDKQIADIQAGKLPTFHEGQVFEYAYAFQGLAEVFNAEEPDAGFKALFDDSTARLYDNGVQYSYTIRNNTSEHVKGSYLLVSYDATKEYASQYPYVQIFSMDLDLKPGQQKQEMLVSTTWNLSHYDMLWLEFENEAERSEFLSDSRLVRDKLTGGYGLDYGAEKKITVEAADSWFEEYLEIPVTVAK